MGLGSFLSGVLSPVGRVIGGAISSLASNIGGAIPKLAPKISEPFLKFNIEKIFSAADAICSVIGLISDVMGLKNKEESTQEIGMKAEEGIKQEIKPEKFASYEEYINNIRKDVEIDQTKLESLSNQDKIKYGIVGSAILVKGIEEKEKFEIPAIFVSEIGRQNLSSQETMQYIKEFKKNNLRLNDFTNYLDGSIDDKLYLKVGNIIESSIKILNPDITDNELDNKIIDMKKSARE